MPQKTSPKRKILLYCEDEHIFSNVNELATYLNAGNRPPKYMTIGLVMYSMDMRANDGTIDYISKRTQTRLTISQYREIKIEKLIIKRDDPTFPD